MASYLLPVTMSFFVGVSCMILFLQRLLVPLYVDSRVRVCVISFPFLHKHTRAQGQNIILNMNDHGFVVCAYNRTVAKVDQFLANEAKGRSS